MCLACFAVIFAISVTADFSRDRTDAADNHVGIIGYAYSKVGSGGIWMLCMCIGLSICTIFTTCKVVSELHDEKAFTRMDYLVIGLPNLFYLLLTMVTYAKMKPRIEYHPLIVLPVDTFSSTSSTSNCLLILKTLSLRHATRPGT